MRLKIVIILGLFFTFGCSPKPLSKEIVGTWKLNNILDGKRNITKTRDPKGDRLLIFNKDGSYKTSSSVHHDQIGLWSLDTVKNEIFMDSEGGSGDDSTWKIKYKNDTLFFVGKSYFVKTVKAKWVRVK